MNQQIETQTQNISDTASFVAAFGGADNSTAEETKGEKALARQTKARAIGKPKAAGKPARGGLAAALKSTRATKPAKATKAKPDRAADQLAAKAAAKSNGSKAAKADKAAGKGKSDPATATETYKHEPLTKTMIEKLAATPDNAKELLDLDGQYTKSSHVEHLLRNGAGIAGKPLTIVDIVDVLDAKYPKNHRRRVLRRVRKVIASCEKRNLKIAFVDVPNKLVP